jgi:hypothetical protein
MGTDALSCSFLHLHYRKLSFLQVDCSAHYLFHAFFLLDLFFDPEDGNDMFLQNVGCLSTEYKALYLKNCGM